MRIVSHMTTRRHPLVWGVALLTAALAVTGCAPEPDAAPTPTSTPVPSPTITPVPIAEFPFGPSTSTTALPADCESILNEDIIASLDGIALNAPGLGGGIRPDSSRVCVWADPGASMTRLVTVVGYAPKNEAIDAMNALAESEDFLCYSPDEGVRCEKTWEDGALGLPQGRTIYYRDGVAIDTQYSNLTPQGYTTAIVAALWPNG